MNQQFFRVALATAGVLALLSRVPAAAQTAPAAPKATTAPAAKSWTPPRTPWGEPDLQGTYSNRTITPFERPASVEGREFYTREEVKALETRAQDTGGDENRNRGTTADVERAYNDFWWDRGTRVTTPRTSLVVDPRTVAYRR